MADTTILKLRSTLTNKRLLLYVLTVFLSYATYFEGLVIS